MQKSPLKLGEILVNDALVAPEQLKKALGAQRREGGRIGEVLVKMEYITERDVVAALGKQLGIPFATYSSGLLRPASDQGLDRLVPEEMARAHRVLPLSRNLESLTVAFADPLDVMVLDNLRQMTGCEINPVIATPHDLVEACNEFYGKRDLLQEAIDHSYKASVEFAAPEEKTEDLSLDDLVAKAEEAPVVKLVDLLLREAVDEGASDIHLEPMRDRMSVRYRIDGMLREIPPPARHFFLPLVSRVKLLANMDIAEKRLPQDGSFLVRVKNRVVDVRVSAIPTIHGEKVVLRVLDKAVAPLELQHLGFSPAQLELFEQAIQASHGLLLLTGPTGSGKTTTLYAALNRVRTGDRNVVTIEDPVEYRLDGINQVQAKPDIGLTFAAALRSFLRQDPDIMMVGEVRDLETAQMCVRASLTGHLVFSTLHTNDAPGAVSRLVDIGIEPYLIVAALRLVAAQRLVRKLCQGCKEAYEPSAEERKTFRLSQDLVYRAKGCETCRRSGYRGRTGVFELLPVGGVVRELVYQGAPHQRLREAAVAAGMQTLRDRGLQLVDEGVTTVEEVLRVTM